MAWWSLGLGLAPCTLGWLVSIGLAVTVLLRSRGGVDHGRGLAIGALAAAGLWLAVTAAVAVLALSGVLDDDADRDADGRIERRQDLGVMSLREGDCFDDSGLAGGAPETTDVTGLPCDEPHQFQVVDVVVLPDGDYPGDREVRRAARRCNGAFRAAYRAADRDSRRELEPFHYTPTSLSWDRFDDREVLCVVGSRDGGLTTSLVD